MKIRNEVKIAQACHAVHNIHCQATGNKVTPWEERTPEHQAIVINSVEKVLSGEITSPEEAHENFVHMKEQFGWEYGEEFSTKYKTSPALCDYDELEPVARQSTEFFFAVASTFKK